MSFVHKMNMTVKWGDCDPAGIIYYPNYYRYFDNSTWAFFEEIGMPMQDLSEVYPGSGFPLVETFAKYRKPCLFRDRLVVETLILELTHKIVKFGHRVFKENVLLAEGHELKVWCINDENSPDRFSAAIMPEEVYSTLKKQL